MTIAWPKMGSAVTLLGGTALAGAVAYVTQACPAFADWRSILSGAGMAAVMGVVHLYQAKPQKTPSTDLDTTIVPK